MGDGGMFSKDVTRRDAMKTALKAGAYAAPVVLAASVPGMVSAATPAPGGLTITGVLPNGGPTTGGTVVTLTGTGFCAGAVVTVNGVPATNVVVNGTGTTITLTTPPGAVGGATIAVTCPNGSGTGGFTYRAITATGEAYSANASVLTLINASKIGDVILPPGGTTTPGTVNIPGTLLLVPTSNSALNISNTTPGSVTARSNATVSSANVLGGAITGGTISATSTSTSNGITASSTAAFSGTVTIGATTYDLATTAANTPVNIPGVANVILNRVVTNTVGANSSQTATAVYVTLLTLLLNGVILEIATASSGVTST